MLAVFAEFERDILRDRVKAGIAQARKEGRPHGRPPTVAKYALRVRELAKKGISKSEISRRLRISRTLRTPNSWLSLDASPVKRLLRSNAELLPSTLNRA